MKIQPAETFHNDFGPPTRSTIESAVVLWQAFAPQPLLSNSDVNVESQEAGECGHKVASHLAVRRVQSKPISGMGTVRSKTKQIKIKTRTDSKCIVFSLPLHWAPPTSPINLLTTTTPSSMSRVRNCIPYNLFEQINDMCLTSLLKIIGSLGREL